MRMKKEIGIMLEPQESPRNYSVYPIDYVDADNGGLDLYAGPITIHADTVDDVVEAILDHGLSESVFSASSMHFASEYGFDTDNGAMLMYKRALELAGV